MGLLTYKDHLRTYELTPGTIAGFIHHRLADLPFAVVKERTPLLNSTGRGTGILTCCPSTTPFGLALGPD